MAADGADHRVGGAADDRRQPERRQGAADHHEKAYSIEGEETFMLHQHLEHSRRSQCDKAK